MAKNKVKISLDDIDLKKGVVNKDELIKIRDMKFAGGTKKLPSLIARTMAESMLKDIDSGTYIDASGMDDDKKKLVAGAFRRDFSRILKAAGRAKELRVRSRDQGNRVIFFFVKKKDADVKEIKVKSSKKKK